MPFGMAASGNALHEFVMEKVKTAKIGGFISFDARNRNRAGTRDLASTYFENK